MNLQHKFKKKMMNTVNFYKLMKKQSKKTRNYKNTKNN